MIYLNNIFKFYNYNILNIALYLFIYLYYLYISKFFKFYIILTYLFSLMQVPLQNHWHNRKFLLRVLQLADHNDYFLNFHNDRIVVEVFWNCNAILL